MGTSDFTMTVWAYPTAFTSSWKGIIGGDNNSFVFGTYGIDGSLYCSKNGVAGSNENGLKITLNTWNFIAVVFDSTATVNNVTFYKNDVSALCTLNYDFDAGYSNYIGQLGTDLNHWQGNIDEVGIWKRKLTNSEVLSLYNNGTGKTYPFI